MKVIFTADDFGAYQQIDHAVLQAVEAGKIHSVAVFPNGFALKQKIRKLEAAAKRTGTNLDVGCHFTTCSGSPLTQVTKNFVSGRYFRPYNRVRRASKSEKAQELDSLYRELYTQVETIKNITDVTHLTCHNNTLMWFEDYFRVFLQIAREFKLPIRSPLFVPEDQFDRYQKAMGLVNYQLSGKERTRLSYKDWRLKYRKSYPEFMKKYGVKHPSVLYTDHYGPPPVLRLNEGDLQGEFVRKQTALNTLFEVYAKEHEVVEAVFHLIHFDMSKRKKYRGLLKRGWYNGVNHKYTDGRMTEMRSLMNFNVPEGVELTSWSDL